MPDKFKPRSSREITKSIIRQRVLLAMYVYTYRYDFLSAPTYKRLIADVGVKLARIKTAIAELKASGLIEDLPLRHQHTTGINVYLLSGHPDIPSYLDFLDQCGTHIYWTPDWREEMQEYERRCADLRQRDDETYEEYEIRTGQCDQPSSVQH